MRKTIIIMSLLLLVYVFPVFCSSENKPNVTMSFKVYKDYDTQAAWNFQIFFSGYEEGVSVNDVIPNVPSSSNSYTITSYQSFTDINVNSNLSHPQLGFGLWIKNLFNFSIRFTFSKMKMSGTNYTGGYDVRIYKPKYFNNGSRPQYSDTLSDLEELEDWSDVHVTSDGVSCAVDFHDRKYSYNGTDYPRTMASGATFQKEDPQYDNGREGWLYPIAFSFSGYTYEESGNYSATIKVEVISN